MDYKAGTLSRGEFEGKVEKFDGEKGTGVQGGGKRGMKAGEWKREGEKIKAGWALSMRQGATSFHLTHPLQQGHYKSMKPAQSHIQLEPKIYEHSSVDVEKHRVSAERRIRKTTADDEDLVYSKEELFEELRQAEKDADRGLLPEFDSVEEMLKSLGI